MKANNAYKKLIFSFIKAVKFDYSKSSTALKL